MLCGSAISDTVYSAINVLGTDIFYDSPVGDKGSASTLYGAYNHCDYDQYGEYFMDKWAT